jgi:site-specific recombinase XerD
MSLTKIYLTKRQNKKYYLCLKHSDGRVTWKSTKCTKKPDALLFLKTFQIESKKDEKIPLFSEYMRMFMSLNASVLRKRTLTDYERASKKFLSFVGDKQIDKYTSHEFETIRARELERGISISTVNIFTRSIKSILGFSVRQGMLPYNPLAKLKQIKQSKRLPLFLTYDQMQLILTFADNRTIRDLIQFTAMTGLRLSEIVNLRWENIDIANNQIVITNYDDFQTKSGKSRVVPIHQKMMELILRQRRAKYLFSKSNGMNFHKDFITHYFKKCVRKAGLPEEIHFHSLRHTFASWLVQSGVDIYSVQQLLGHSDVATTQIYAHLTPSHLQSAVNKIQI